MSDCLTATNGVDNVRKLQRALYRTSKQDKTKRFYSLYDKVWRVDGFPGASEKECNMCDYFSYGTYWIMQHKL